MQLTHTHTHACKSEDGGHLAVLETCHRQSITSHAMHALKASTTLSCQTKHASKFTCCKSSGARKRTWCGPSWCQKKCVAAAQPNLPVVGPRGHRRVSSHHKQSATSVTREKSVSMHAQTNSAARHKDVLRPFGCVRWAAVGLSRPSARRNHKRGRIR